MRGRTPLADDTPKRAPPVPTREAAPASPPSARPTAADTSPCFPSPPASKRLVTSTLSVDEHPPTPQEPYYRTSQTTQDKRSRLSNVINSLYRKVPVSSVEKNLETLEKYVMTVLNGVIKDAETDDHRKSDETSYNGPNEDSRTDDKSSTEPSAVEPAIPSVSEAENKQEVITQEDSIASSNDRIQTKEIIAPESSISEEKIQSICHELLSDLVTEISQMEEPSTPTSLQCSLPLDKVAPVLDICETTQHSSKSTVRHLCLYCDRKFLSISLRQRHTERVHQIGGGRRSDRNNRKTNCQYCSEKSTENLDCLFRHMIDSHSDKYHGCLQCSTRYGTREALVAHTNELHPNDKMSVKRENIRSQIKMFTPMKLNMLPRDETQDFDSTFYNNVSCNIRENLLHHLDGKLHHNSCYQSNCPIEISLTAATPVNKEYPAESDNSSEYAQKPGKISSSHPRRVSFEKYNFPKKYDGKEPWTGIGDLSKFDISTQLTLRKKQQMLREKLVSLEAIKFDVSTDVIRDEESEKNDSVTEFSGEFGDFLRLRRWDSRPVETVKDEEIGYAELTGEWSRPRVYICGACYEKHQTLKDLEDHKVLNHPNVWCSHLEFSGDQTELDKHLVLPGRGAAIMKAKDAVLSEKVCTKCLKTCGSLSELHKHMLECGGDQTWLLGLFGNGKKKCKWRPFGSRRRRQRGMKRNIQNSQDSKNQVNKTPKEKLPSGPRIRPSDRETIEKMIANLPAKRSTRKVTQEINLRSQARLCKIQTRSKQRLLEIASNSRLSRKAVLRNKLIKNAKSFQRKRCRGDDISAAIESVISNYDVNTRRSRLNERIYKNVTVVSKRRNIKMQGKSLKTRKTLADGKITRSNVQESAPVTRRKRSNDLLASLASMKAKSQLRTNDGKFARKNENQSSRQITRSSSTRLSTRSRINVGLSRRGTDGDRMPTLEPADKSITRLVEASSDLPVLVSANISGDSKESNDKGKKRGRRSNLEKAKLKIEGTEENVKVVVTRNRKSLESQSENQSDSTKKSVPQSIKKTKSPVKTADLTRTRRSRNSVEDAPKSEASNGTPEVKTPRKIKRNKQLQKKKNRPKILKETRKLQEDSNENTRDISATRKSPRNLEKKLVSVPSFDPLPVEITEESSLKPEETPNREESKEYGELPFSEGEPESGELGDKTVNEPIDTPESPKPLGNTPDPQPNPPEAESLEKIEEIVKNDEKIEEIVKNDEKIVEKIVKNDENPLENDEKPLENDEKPLKNDEKPLEKIPELLKNQSSPIEIVNDLVPLNFEHLQQESSNSNIDSGKENSSETPITLLKSKIPKPKKSRGLKRDRQSKRTLNNVIGILTEGVNIPIEVQQSVVLTVQTSIESITVQSHNNTVQTEGSRVELGENNASHSNSDDAGLSVDAINKDNNESDSVNIEGSSQEASIVQPEVKTSNNPPAGTNTVEQFSNDIILDLSRRKQNGKGSFLEKIVSKIAKQKDVLLDHDVGSLLDHAADELSIILDDVSPKSVENPNEAPKCSETGQKQKELVQIEAAEENEPKILEVSHSDKPEESNKTIESAPEPINQDESREIDRSSKKRSSDTTLPARNKKKTVNEDETPEIEDDMYLSDIMKLINKPGKIEENRNGKRKMEDKANETTNGDFSSESDNKKRRNRKENKSITVNKGRRSNRRNTSVEKLSDGDKTTENSVILNEPSTDGTSPDKSEVTNAPEDSENTEIVPEKPIKSKGRGSLKKKSLADEHLDLSDDEINTEESLTEEKSRVNTCDESEDKRLNNSESIEVERPVSPPVHKDPKSLKRRNNHGEIEVPDTPVQRRQTLRRKAKENIFLIEELLDFGDDIDSPPEVNKIEENDKNIEEENKEEDAVVQTIKESEVQTNEVKEPENPIEELPEINPVINEPNPENIEILGEPDDSQSPKKRASGNFAVVHTKCGKILIVEKKKKFTKEAAKFFCDVCTTSFTRKSSLKKHNLSQSHILQVSKCSNEQESLSVSETTLTNSSQPEENPNVEVLEEKGTLGNSTIDTTAEPFNSQLEEELLDEEICKITENMTHDEYVLTDHISPEEGETLEKIEETELISKQKVNLAEEHLELESPQAPKHQDQLISSTPEIPSPNPKMSLDFSNITEKLMDKKFLQNDQKNSIDFEDKNPKIQEIPVETEPKNPETIEEVKTSSPKKSKSSPEKSRKKSKTRTKRSKKKSQAETLASETEDSDTENTKSQDKNKIVKSVFGRVFTGEKLDKVMEVLDDWNSKSESEIPDDSKDLTPEKQKIIKEPKDKSVKRSKSTKTNESLPLEIPSRCRQSKKRAEERISRAFEEESIPYDLAFSLEKDSEKIKSPDKTKNPPESDQEDQKLEITSPNRKILNEEDTNSMESIHTRVPSCPRERSSTPDLISVTTRDSYNEAEGFPSEDEGMSVRGRLSPFYASNAPESSMNSGTLSNHVNTEGFMNSNDFSGEKIVIRSPVSSQESPGVVTIAPTDAIEDNALDVPQEMEEKPPRQGKVLNFDEELFVECCSRLKATTENELRGAKKIKLDHTDDYQSRDETTQQSSGQRGLHDRWRDVESQNSLGSLLESVNQLLGEEMYNSNRADSHKRRERTSPVRTPQTDFIRPDNISYEDSLDVAFEHNNKLRDKIQQRMRESENMIATSFGQKGNSRNYRQHYDVQKEKEDGFDYSEHVPIERSIENKINPRMDGFLDEALSNLLHRNGKHDHNGSTPMNVLAELACAQVPSTTPSLPEKSTLHKPSSDPPKKPRNPIKELFERKKELNDRKKDPLPPKQKSKKPKHQNDSPLIRKSHFGPGLPERKKRHNDKKSEISSTKRIKDVYEFDEEDSGDTKFSSKISYRTHTEKLLDPTINHVSSKDSNLEESISRSTPKSLEGSKNTLDSSGKRSDDSYLPKTKGALKSFTIEEKNQRDKQTKGPMDNFVERKHHRSRRSTECSNKTSKTKRKSKNSKKRSRNAWYEDDSSDEFVTAFKAESVGVGITKSQRTCSKGKQNLFAELSSTSSESEYEEIQEVKDDKSVEINEWMDGVTKSIDDNEKIESDSPLVIDEKESDDDDRSERGFELDDLYREDSSVASSDSEENNPPKEDPPEVENKKFEENDLIPLDEALVLLDNEEEKNSIDSTEDLPEKLSSNEKPSDNLPLHVFLSRKVQESKKKKEEKLKKLQKEKEKIEERERKREQEELANDIETEKIKEQFIEFQSTRRQRKCAIGKQGLLAEISSSEEEYYADKRGNDDKSRRQKRESKEKRKERYLEKKHELMIAKEQKAIEEEILREVKMKKGSEGSDDNESFSKKEKINEAKPKNKQLNNEIKPKKMEESDNKVNKKNGNRLEKKKEESSSEKKSRKSTKSVKKSKVNGENQTKERNKRDADDEELRTTKSWNKVDEGVGVAIGRRKRAAANQLYYWSSSSDDDEGVVQAAPVVEEEDDRQEQHGWIVGDSHKKMITMLAMEKQLKEKRRRSEDEFDLGKTKNKKHRNSTS